MGIIHTPRTIASIAKGLLKRRLDPSGTWSAGLGNHQPYLYQARAGLFDVDYLGHLNNAAYLNHAELARWEFTSYNGLLETMMKHQANFLVAGTAVRYRREIRPLWRRFQIDTSVSGMDERNFWIVHNFRYPIEGRNRVRAQIIIRGVFVQGKSVLNPGDFLRDMVGVDPELAESLTMPNVSEKEIEAMFEQYLALEDSFRKVASKDDETHEGL